MWTPTSVVKKCETLLFYIIILYYFNSRLFEKDGRRLEKYSGQGYPCSGYLQGQKQVDQVGLSLL